MVDHSESIILQIQEIFPMWDTEEISLLLTENHGDADIVIQRIAEGHAQKWSSNNKSGLKNFPGKGRSFVSKRYRKVENLPSYEYNASPQEKIVVQESIGNVIAALKNATPLNQSHEYDKTENVSPKFEAGVSMPLHASCRPMQQSAVPVVIFPIKAPVRADVNFKFKNECQNFFEQKTETNGMGTRGLSYGSKYVSDDVYLPPGFNMDNPGKGHMIYNSITSASIKTFESREKTWSRGIAVDAKENSWNRLSFNRPDYQAQYLSSSAYFSHSP